MKLRNYGSEVSERAPKVCCITCLQERVLFLLLKLVGTKKFDSTLCLVIIETVLVTLKEFEDILNNDGLEVDLFFVIQVLRFQLNLTKGKKLMLAVGAVTSHQ